MGCCQAVSASRPKSGATLDEEEFVTGVSAATREKSNGRGASARAAGDQSREGGQANRDPRPEPGQPEEKDSRQEERGAAPSATRPVAPTPAAAAAAAAVGEGDAARRDAPPPQRPAAAAGPRDTDDSLDRNLKLGKAPSKFGNFSMPPPRPEPSSRSPAPNRGRPDGFDDTSPRSGGEEWKFDPAELEPGAPPFLDDPGAVKKTVGFQLARHLREAGGYGGTDYRGNDDLADDHPELELVTDVEDARVNMDDFNAGLRASGLDF